VARRTTTAAAVVQGPPVVVVTPRQLFSPARPRGRVTNSPLHRFTRPVVLYISVMTSTNGRPHSDTTR